MRSSMKLESQLVYHRSRNKSTYLLFINMKRRHAVTCLLSLKPLPNGSWDYIMCSSAQLSKTRTPISSLEATGNTAMLVLSNLEHSRACGFRRKSSGILDFPDFDTKSPQNQCATIKTNYSLKKRMSRRFFTRYAGIQHG